MLFPLILTHGQGAEGAEVRRAYQRGDLLRLRRGCYSDAKTWYGYKAWNRYDAFAEAVGVTQRTPVLILETAARIWGLPLRKVPRDIQVRAPRHSLIRRCAARMLRHELAPVVSGEKFRPRGFGVRHRFVPRPEVVRCSSVVVSNLRDTAVQCAAYLTWEDAVMVVDAAVAGRSWQRASLEELVARVDEVVEPRKRRRARAVLAFASAAAETAGESLSRVVIDQLGFEPPQLQVEIFDNEGLAGRVDFAWRVKDRLIAGEFDGAVKYGRGADAHGRVSVDALVEEKRREDRIRATGAGMVRWMWQDLNEPDQLRRLLEQAGVPKKRRSTDTAHLLLEDSTGVTDERTKRPTTPPV